MTDGKVFIGERVLHIKPFNLKTLRVVLPRVASLSKLGGRLPNEDEVDSIIEILLAAFRDNKPAVTKEFLEENIDIGMLDGLFNDIMIASGLTKSAPGEAPSP